MKKKIFVVTLFALIMGFSVSNGFSQESKNPQKKEIFLKDQSAIKNYGDSELVEIHKKLITLEERVLHTEARVMVLDQDIKDSKAIHNLKWWQSNLLAVVLSIGALIWLMKRSIVEIIQTLHNKNSQSNNPDDWIIIKQKPFLYRERVFI